MNDSKAALTAQVDSTMLQAEIQKGLDHAKILVDQNRFQVPLAKETQTFLRMPQ